MTVIDSLCRQHFCFIGKNFNQSTKPDIVSVFKYNKKKKSFLKHSSTSTTPKPIYLIFNGSFFSEEKKRKRFKRKQRPYEFCLVKFFCLYFENIFYSWSLIQRKKEEKIDRLHHHHHQ